MKHLGITGGVSMNLFVPEGLSNVSGIPTDIAFSGSSSSLIASTVQNNINLTWIG